MSTYKNIKLHLGCGKRNFGNDWIHIDGGNYPHLHSHDIINLPFKKDSVNVIYASHVLEYFDRKEAKHVLKKWYNVLRPNGILKLAVPDFEAMAKLYVIENYSLDNFLGPLYGKMKMGNKTIYHRTVYDYDSLKNLINEVGFKKFSLFHWQNYKYPDDCSRAYIPKMDFENGTLISLNVKAVK